jgi:hypothetical protein
MWNSKPFVIFLSVVAAAALLFLFLAWRTVTLHKYLLHNGIQVPGKIVEHYFGIGSRGYGGNHYYTYRFPDSRGRSHESEFIQGEPDNRFDVGKEIEIIYDPLGPSRNIPSIMVPDEINQPIYSSLKLCSQQLG